MGKPSKRKVDSEYFELKFGANLEQFENKAKRHKVINRYKSITYTIIKDVLKLTIKRLSA